MDFKELIALHFSGVPIQKSFVLFSVSYAIAIPKIETNIRKYGRKIQINPLNIYYMIWQELLTSFTNVKPVIRFT